MAAQPLVGADPELAATDPLQLDELPAAQRETVLVALGVIEAMVPDLFLIVLATLDLLGDAATRSPLDSNVEHGRHR